jgi:hypothetical protein
MPRVHGVREGEEERETPASRPDQPAPTRAPATPQQVLALQRTAGNHAVSMLMREDEDEEGGVAVAVDPYDALLEHLHDGDHQWCGNKLTAMSDEQLDEITAKLIGANNAQVNEAFHKVLESFPKLGKRVMAAGARATLRQFEAFSEEALLKELSAVPSAQLQVIAGVIATAGAAAARVLRIIQYAMTRPSSAPKGKLDIVNKGAVAHCAKLGEGTISVHTGVGLKGEATQENYTVGYEGKDADQMQWLQFIWREVEVTHPDRGKYRLGDEITTTGGTYKLTTDPSKPNYNTDSADKKEPFYTVGGMGERTADATTMLDEPSPMTKMIEAAYDAGATAVTSRAHFTTYMLKGMDVAYRLGIDVEWATTSKTVPPRTQKVSSGAEATALDPRQRERLLQQFPAYEWIP